MFKDTEFKYTSLTAIALVVGTVVGAGILGLPLVFAKAGFWQGMINLIIIGGASLLMTLYVAELSLRTRKKHQLAGFAMKYLGEEWKYVLLIAETLGIYAVMIAYLIGIGQSLSNLFGGSAVIWSTIFFVLSSPFIYIGLRTLSKTEFLITSAKLLLVFGIIFVMLPSINTSNLKTTFNFSTLFLPYGVVLFATLGYTIIPQVEEIMKYEKHKIKDVIIISMIITFMLYALFTLAFVGNYGINVKEIATLSLTGKLSFFGNLFVLLTMITPFIALSSVVKDIYIDDFNLDKRLSWFLAAFIPFMLFLYLDFDFITLIETAGTYAFGFMGIMTCLMVMNARKQIPETKPEFVVPGGNVPIYFTMIIFIGGIIYHTAAIFGII